MEKKLQAEKTNLSQKDLQELKDSCSIEATNSTEEQIKRLENACKLVKEEHLTEEYNTFSELRNSVLP